MATIQPSEENQGLSVKPPSEGGSRPRGEVAATSPREEPPILSDGELVARGELRLFWQRPSRPQSAQPSH